MEFLSQLGLFTAQTILIVGGIIAIILTIAAVAAKSQNKPELEIEHLHKRYKNLENLLKENTLTKEELKLEKKALKKAEEKEDKSKQHQPRLFVIDFDGDTKASAVDQLREEVTAILTTAKPQDEVLVRVESPGGVVYGYGLAASQLMRIRDAQIPLTIAVDKVAASGGYLMSCVANKILCAPFAIVGSIGVVAQVPNLHRLLKKHDVDYREYTAGEFKRTISFLGEITPKGEEKFLEQLEATHLLFKDFVHSFRPQLELSKVATGEYWYGKQAKDLQLVDEITTSDDYMLKRAKSWQIIKVKFQKKMPLSEKLSHALGQSLRKAGVSLLSDLQKRDLI